MLTLLSIGSPSLLLCPSCLEGVAARALSVCLSSPSLSCSAVCAKQTHTHTHTIYMYMYLYLYICIAFAKRHMHCCPCGASVCVQVCVRACLHVCVCTADGPWAGGQKGRLTPFMKSCWHWQDADDMVVWRDLDIINLDSSLLWFCSTSSKMTTTSMTIISIITCCEELQLQLQQ